MKRHRVYFCLLWCVFACHALAEAETAKHRTIDGKGNNLFHPLWGAARTPLLRLADADYQDGIAEPVMDRPNPRDISNRLGAQRASVKNGRDLSDYVWLWGQFVDHDIGLTHAADPVEPLPIPLPRGDAFFDPVGTGTQMMFFARSEYDSASGTSPGNPRRHINAITSYIDASQVYGSDTNRARELRVFTNGKLKVGDNNMLPFNTNGFPNANGGPLPESRLLIAGDVRANEHLGLTALHTLFVREHNRLCAEIATNHPTWGDERIYQRARKWVGALMQVVTYNEFLPALLGESAPSPSGAYDTNVNASISTEFSTALYRLGHSMVSHRLMLTRNDNMPAAKGPMPVRDAFFDPSYFTNTLAMDHLCKGSAARRHEAVDPLVVDDLRNFLFGPSGAGGFDLASLNVQRGRDHGLPDYNACRLALGLEPALDMADITSDTGVQQGLGDLYGGVTNIDLWVGALSEDHLPGCAVGELLAVGLSNQFVRLRDGDRFWYENDPDLTAEDMDRLKATRLSDIIRRNTGITTLQDDVFRVIPEPELMLARSDSASDMRVMWRSASNATYQMQAADHVAGGRWRNMGGMIDGDDSMMSMAVTSSVPATRFYRIIQYP